MLKHCQATLPGQYVYLHVSCRRYDVPRTESPTPIEIPGLVGLVLDMKKLAETPIENISRTLMPLITAYEDWIAQQAARIDDPANDLAEYRSVALSGYAGMSPHPGTYS